MYRGYNPVSLVVTYHTNEEKITGWASNDVILGRLAPRTTPPPQVKGCHQRVAIVQTPVGYPGVAD